MPQIILTPEQSQLLASALQPVELRDTAGHLLAVVPPSWTEAEIQTAERALASEEPGYSFAQVMEQLRALDHQ